LRRRALASTLALLLAAPLAGAPAACGSGGDGGKDAKAPRSDFVGLVSEDVYAGDPDYQDATLEQERSLGVDILRQTFHWNLLEPSPGRYDFSDTDRFVLATARHGIAVLPILFDPPSFVTGKNRPSKSNTVDPPRDPADMAKFATVLVKRYGPRGTLWKSHPKAPKVPVRSWQIWNEPNLPQYWSSHPDAAAYANLLAVVSKAIKRADGGATVVSAGLPNSKNGVPFTRYATDFYKAGAKKSFDVLGLHPYTSSANGVISAVRRTRKLMTKFGDARKPIWLTELGWASGGPKSPFTFDPLSQAQLIGNSINALSAQRRKLRIAGFVYFGWKDAPPYPGRADFWGLHTGLLNLNGSAKPALAAFRDAVRRSGG
jgi:hypothetical protein